MVQSITSNLPTQALRQLSISPALDPVPIERLTTGPRASTPAETEPNRTPVRTSSINPLDMAAREPTPIPVSVNGTEPQPFISVDHDSGIYSEASNQITSQDVRQQLSAQALSNTSLVPKALQSLFR
jgi:hypothetical protein